MFATAIRHALSERGFFDMLFDEDKAPMAFAVILTSIIVCVIMNIIRERKK